MHTLQALVFTTVPQSGVSNSVTMHTRNDLGIESNFGKSFHTLSDIELPFLQRVKKISKHKKIITLEIAAANGLVSWKVPLAFENNGIHYANELSSTMMEEEFKPLLSDCYSILKEQYTQASQIPDFMTYRHHISKRH